MKYSDLRNKLDNKVDHLNEDNLGSDQLPAALLILRREGIRQFPGGRKVAVYKNDQYGIVFTVPFGAGSGNQTIPGTSNGYY